MTKTLLDETAEIVLTMCIVGFFVLIFGTAAAVFGGNPGSPDYVDYS